MKLNKQQQKEHDKINDSLARTGCPHCNASPYKGYCGKCDGYYYVTTHSKDCPMKTWKNFSCQCGD